MTKDAQDIGLPTPPSDLLFEVSQNADPAVFHESSRGMANSILEHLDSAGGIQKAGTFLDFGCGVGKALIGVNRRRPDIELHGCDIDERRVEWCQSKLDFAETYANSLSPPLKYGNNSFDAINAVSVFTHLSIKPQFQWAWELYRVLKPGGLLHFTTHGIGYMSLFAQIAATRDAATRCDLITFGPDALFMDLEQSVTNENYQSKEGQAVQGQLEIASAHNAAAIQTIFAPFKLLKHHPQQSIGDGHDAYVLQKPKRGVATVCMEIEAAQLPAAQRSVTFNLPITGQNRFVVFVAAAHPGVHRYKLTGAVTASLGGRGFHNWRHPLSQGVRLFGPSTFTPIAFALPAKAMGDLTVTIEVESPDGTYPEMLHWLAPHAFSIP